MAEAESCVIQPDAVDGQQFLNAVLDRPELFDGHVAFRGGGLVRYLDQHVAGRGEFEDRRADARHEPDVVGMQR